MPPCRLRFLTFCTKESRSTSAGRDIDILVESLAMPAIPATVAWPISAVLARQLATPWATTGDGEQALGTVETYPSGRGPGARWSDRNLIIP